MFLVGVLVGDVMLHCCRCPSIAVATSRSRDVSVGVEEMMCCMYDITSCLFRQLLKRIHYIPGFHSVVPSFLYVLWSHIVSSCGLLSLLCGVDFIRVLTCIAPYAVPSCPRTAFMQGMPRTPRSVATVAVLTAFNVAAYVAVAVGDAPTCWA